MVVKLVKQDEEVMNVVCMDRGILCNEEMSIPVKFFNKHFKSEEVSRNKANSKKGMYYCQENISKEISWWAYNIYTVDYLYKRVYEGDITKDAPYCLDSLNDLYDDYKKKFKVDHAEFCNRYKLFKDMF